MNQHGVDELAQGSKRPLKVSNSENFAWRCDAISTTLLRSTSSMTFQSGIFSCTISHRMHA